MDDPNRRNGNRREPASVDHNVIDRLADTERLLVASDFDGVLAPLVDDPASSVALPSAIDALARLGRAEATAVAIVSGRERRQLESLVPGADRFLLVGSHGAELDGTEPDDRSRALLESLVGDLVDLAGSIEGLHVERKALSVAVHFRRVVSTDREPAATAVERLRQAWPAKVVTGKDVVEFTIGTAHKGDALRSLGREVGATCSVFLGDDVTDEDAFAVLGPDDVGIKVGPGSTTATHRVDSPEAAAEFLNRLAERRGSDRS